MAMTRRGFSKIAIGLGLGPALLARALPARAGGEAFAQGVAAIEARLGARVGAAVLDTGTGALLSHRGDERFPMCSTFKALAAAAILAKVDRGEARLDARLPILAEDMLSHAPASEKRIGGTMSLDELCDAAVTLSDNPAANKLLGVLGGPESLTRYLRSIGDPTTRLDRWELALNEARPGDERDTTTPLAIVATLDRLVLGDALSVDSRERLAGWLVANTTGDARLRAGMPKGWRVGDKTGTGARGTANDIGIAWPPERAPLVVAVYITETEASLDARNAAIADIARLAADVASG